MTIELAIIALLYTIGGFLFYQTAVYVDGNDEKKRASISQVLLWPAVVLFSAATGNYERPE